MTMQPLDTYAWLAVRVKTLMGRQTLEQATQEYWLLVKRMREYKRKNGES